MKNGERSPSIHPWGRAFLMPALTSGLGRGSSSSDVKSQSKDFDDTESGKSHLIIALNLCLSIPLTIRYELMLC